MKAQKILGLMALASCVMLAGCGKNDELEVKDMPTEFVLGQEINLDDYVTYGKNNNYRIVPSEESAAKLDINGHKITVIGNEEVSNIKIKVVAGDSSKDISFDAVCGMRKQLEDLFKDVGYDYSTYDWYESDDGGLEADGGYYHNENYVWMDYWMEAEDGETVYPRGLVQLSNGVYSFYMDDEDEIVVEPKLKSKKSLAAYNGPLSLDLSKLEYIPYLDDDGVSHDCLSFSEDDSGSLYNFLSTTVLFQDYVEYYDVYLIPDHIEFEFMEVEDEDGNVENQLFGFTYVTIEGEESEPFAWSVNSFIPGKEEASLPALDEYIAQSKTPDLVDYSTIKDFLGETFESGNYTMDINYSWLNSKDKVIDCPDLKGTWFEGCEEFFMNGAVSLNVTENALVKYQIDDSEEAKDTYKFANGLFMQDDTVYEYVRKSATEASVYEHDKYSSIDDAYSEKGAFLFDTENKTNYPDDLFCMNEEVAEENADYFLFNIIRYEPLFKDALNYTVDLGTVDPEGVASFRDIFDYYEAIDADDSDPEIALIELNFYNYFTSMAIVGEDYCEMYFMFGWTSDARYQISVEISNIGTTEIPEDIASQMVYSAE